MQTPIDIILYYVRYVVNLFLPILGQRSPPLPKRLSSRADTLIADHISRVMSYIGHKKSDQQKSLISESDKQWMVTMINRALKRTGLKGLTGSSFGTWSLSSRTSAAHSYVQALASIKIKTIGVWKCSTGDGKSRLIERTKLEKRCYQWYAS